jgi:hypothetical protein
VQQPHIQSLFQQGEALADESWRHAKLFSGNGKAGPAGNQHKDTQVIQQRQIIHDLCFMFHQLA